MNWREATVADLLRGTTGARPETATTRPRRRPARPAVPRAPFAERLLEGTRTVTMLAAVSVIVLTLAAGVVTLLPGLAAGSRLLADDRAGHPVRPLRDSLALVRRTAATTWPISVAVALGLVAVTANLLFLGQQPSTLAAALVAVNLAVVTLGGWWTAACARELADEPMLTRSALIRRATARALSFGRWHVALALAVVVGAGLVLVSPLLAAVFAPALALHAGRLADPSPTPSAREVTS
ncbi:hypothetical protein OCAE111667_15430 [Occultella aeris]|uniref:DUF624 domain-containing protein n=1 Tax=Occultella aeris TaxID=2761496 RepID=A0A7M4DRH0_9MICO|nr:hypothetical protein [Occultella aeris]VZO40064.1 hypothetical protein HALOF300_04765 [Occultella aeris]